MESIIGDLCVYIIPANPINIGERLVKASCLGEALIARIDVEQLQM